MRLRHRDGTVVHVAYCTNVHPTEDVDALLEQVRRYGGGVRARLGTPRLGLGLWLPAPVVARLAGEAGRPELERLRTALDASGLEVVTLNAFPYAGFHDPRVKLAVYHPDWTDASRLRYTLECATVLAGLLPDDAERGSVSSLPLAWRTPWDDQRRRTARDHLDRLADGLAVLEDRTGRVVRVGLEPEPGCVVETIDGAVAELAGVDTERIGVCLDACHLAVQFEEPADAVRRLAAAGLAVVKTQASAALEIADPGSDAARSALGAYAEDRFLHQTRVASPAASGTVDGTDDLPAALDGELPTDGPWRVHYHVPVHERPDPPLAVTQDHLGATLDALFGGEHAVTDHVEVETYTWSVLPAGRRPAGPDGLADGLAAELRWVADRLAETGLDARTTQEEMA
ncbi:metabolite traffic protein EboE [Jiangella asiatica]|uniref:Xylose isomerase n=1 Tax=Jiangella asiatica TaxID=2530372 RepID=A0A4R5DHZ6_9ACTN|nr:metabolite traffic protein EboE [Jiangella asiatica]TDE11514.1 xylose isomerase [Jiangella asiatica]